MKPADVAVTVIVSSAYTSVVRLLHQSDNENKRIELENKTALYSATYVRRKHGTTRICCCAVLRPRAVAAPAVQQSIDIFDPPGPQQQTRRVANETGRRTDTVLFHRPCSA